MARDRKREPLPADEVVLRGPSWLARLLLELDMQWPTLRFMGFGFYYAWIWLCYDSSVLLSGVTNAAGAATDTLFSMYLASTAALALMLLLAAALPGFSSRVVQGRWMPLGASVLAALATVGVKCTAPLGAAHPLFILFCVLTGLGTAWVCLRLGLMYATVPSRQVTLHAAMSFVIAALFYFMARSIPVQLGLVVMALLPVMAACCTLTPQGTAAAQEECPQREHMLPRGFVWRLVLAISVFSLVVGVTRGYSTPTQTGAAVDAQGSLVVFSMAVVALGIYLLVSAVGNDFDISRLYYPVIILAAAGILVVPLVSAQGAFGGVFIGVAYACFVMVMWCLFAHVAYVTGISPVRIFGLGRGASALGTTIGWLAGSQLLAHEGVDGSTMIIISVVMVFALLVVSMLVFNDRAIGTVLRTVGRCPAAQVSGSGHTVPEEVCRACRYEGTSECDGSHAEACEALTAGSSVWAADAPAVWDVSGEQAASANVAHAESGAQAEERPAASDTMAAQAPVGSSDAEAARIPAAGSKTGSWTRSCKEIAERFGLSQRETDVLFLLAKGRTIGFIADDLSVSFNTAKSHIRHVYVKTGVHTRQELLDMVERSRR